ncbi:hypothetical protein FOA19_11745 [Rufibacter hautae]|uniref:Uncharacterized protein n=1 Tax=Rufibacter hautae TaxID=2595005 RepID=A0A5B6TBV3_9BACT|nr:hypothetical protein FOA19_11745 [Rufibacter hautae]
MVAKTNYLEITGWAVSLLLVVIGILNLVFVHPVPAIGYFLFSFIYLPPTNAYLKQKFNFTIPIVVKVILFIFLMMFTLGVSDLGDMIDKL